MTPQKSPNDFARIDLGFSPTPIEQLPRLGAALGIELSIKRDDYSGFGGGGNWVRKLEFLLAEALAAKAKVLVTTGGHQSNHARMVAVAACRLGMRQERVSAMANACAAPLGWDMRLAPEDVWVEDGHVGPGHRRPSESGIAAIRRTARSEGVLLDPVYTGKAMAGVIALAVSGGIASGARVLFAHCGGSPALYPFARELAAEPAA
jgi:1-aminocyclopropane-1-carboxylate deaminase/D-cysteine desulfhydrase-like pyridoxal-dependent ACC family enzyme